MTTKFKKKRSIWINFDLNF